MEIKRLVTIVSACLLIATASSAAAAFGFHVMATHPSSMLINAALMALSAVVGLGWMIIVSFIVATAAEIVERRRRTPAA